MADQGTNPAVPTADPAPASTDDSDPVTTADIEPAPTPEPPPALPEPAVRVREDVWTLSALDEWHPTILWYARAVAALQALNGRDFADPRCWRHLAETHGASIARNRWPAGALWDSCEHGSWNFLTWHRVYLYHFERIVAEQVVALGGPEGWSLPYWDYSDSSRTDVRRLPPAFRRETMPDGQANPLFILERAAAMNQGAKLPAALVSTRDALAETQFSGRFAPGFGGAPARPGTHAGGDDGALELTPHGSVHVGVGGTNPPGFMSAFETAGLDPIFWLHHANIDRLWQAWLRLPGRRNPTAASWLSAQWGFGSGAVTTGLTTADILDPRSSPLRYRYSDMPAQESREVLAERFEEGPAIAASTRPEPPPELVGASAGAVPIGSAVSTARVELSPAAGPAIAAAGAGARELPTGAPPPGARVMLRLEHIRATLLGAAAVEVHVNVPPTGDPADFPGRRAGIVPMFGVLEASHRSESHSGGGKNVIFDITSIVRALAADGSWDPNTMRVTFTPIPDATGEIPSGDVTVGRVSLFYA